MLKLVSFKTNILTFFLEVIFLNNRYLLKYMIPLNYTTWVCKNIFIISIVFSSSLISKHKGCVLRTYLWLIKCFLKILKNTTFVIQ